MIKNIVIAAFVLASSASQAATFDICVCVPNSVSSGPSAGNGYATLHGMSYVKNQDGSVGEQGVRLMTLETLPKPKGQPDVIERALALCGQARAQFVSRDLCPPEGASK
jgi:hypothetical protein